MIDIKQLAGKFEPEILEMLLYQPDPIEICIPASTKKCFNETDSLAVDYLFLAYSGQLLGALPGQFTYEKTSSKVPDHHIFTIETNWLGGLAEALFKISFGYVNNVDDALYEGLNVGFDFGRWASHFISEVEEGRVEPQCPFFCELCDRFLELEQKPNGRVGMQLQARK